MTTDATIVPDGEADIRWQEWQARGAESDRRTAARMRILTLLIATALGIWLAVQLV